MSSHLPTPSDPAFPAHGGDAFPGYGPMPSGPPDPGLMRYVNAILRYKWMILLLGMLGAGVGIAAIQFVTPTYPARGFISTLPGLAGGNPGQPIRAGQLLSTESWGVFVRSAPVMDSVIIDQKLFLEPANAADSVFFQEMKIAGPLLPGTYRLNMNTAQGVMTLVDGNGLERSRAAPGDSIGHEVGLSWVPPVTVMGSRRQLEFTVRSIAAVRNSMATDLVVQPTADGDVLGFRLTGTDPARAAETLNALMERFILKAAEFKAQKLREQAAILAEQKRHADSVLTAAEEEYQRVRIGSITHPTDPMMMGAPISAGVQTEGNILAQYLQHKSNLDGMRRDSAALERILAEPPSSATELVTRLEDIPSVRGNSALSKALSDLTSREATLRTLLQEYTEIWPQVVTEKAARDSLRSRFIPDQVRELIASLGVRSGDLETVIGSQETELRNIPPRSIAQSRAMRVRDAAAEIQRDIQNRTVAATLAAETTEVPDMTILDRASALYTPIQDTRPRILMMCIIGGFGLGILGALLRDRFDPRLRYPSEVTAGMGLHILGAVPSLRRGRIGSGDMALAVEAFRAIQLSLSHAHGIGIGNGNGQGSMAITFTSPGASDGKSFVTSNLAIAFADMGYRTLVIDGDVRRGSLHRMLGTTHKPGLTDFLAGKVTRADIVRTTRYPMLDIIACGSRGEQGPKLLGSPAMSRLIQELRSDYDVILVDSPPLGACVDPMVLGTLTKNLVLILRTGTTDRSMAESKLDVLDRLPVRVLGAILNDVSQNGPYRYYAYMSGYEVLEEVEAGTEIRQLGEGESAEDESI